MKRKVVTALLTFMMICSTVTGCGVKAGGANGAEDTNTTASGMVGDMETPKYVFLFIGDGMSYPQIQLTNYFVSASNQDGETVEVEGEEKEILESKNQLTMMDFEIAGSAQTYDSTDIYNRLAAITGVE